MKKKYVIINIRRPKHYLTDKDTVMTEKITDALFFSLEQGGNIVSQLNEELSRGGIKKVSFGLIKPDLNNILHPDFKTLKAINTLYRQL